MPSPHPSLLVLAGLTLTTIAATQAPAWIQLTPTTPPSARWQHALAYDLVNGNVVMFGGRQTSTSFVDETWTFDGASWTQHNPSPKPTARRLFQMTADWSNARVVLFGGQSSGGLLGDTWLWDGVAWTQATPANSPSPRRQHAMAYDYLRSVVVLFGGNDFSYRNDTWEWNGVDWTQVPTANAPSPRTSRMAFDGTRGEMVLHGGDVQTNVYNGETWVYDGVDWQQRFPAHSPGVRTATAIEYDSARQRVVLFGGFSPAFQNLGDTWEWDGYDWTQVVPTMAPTARRGFDHTTFDAGQQRMLMFGGQASNGTSDETWTFDGSAGGSFVTYAPDCPTPAGAITFTGTTPTVGQSFDLDFANLGSASAVLIAFGGSDQSFGGAPLPLDLASLGLPGCSLRTSADVLAVAVAAGGTANFGWTLPNNPAIYDASFFCQGFALDLTGGATVTGTTGLGRARVGF